MKINRQYWQYRIISNKDQLAFDDCMDLHTSDGWKLVEGSFQTMAAEHNLMYSVLVKRVKNKVVEYDPLLDSRYRPIGEQVDA